MNTQRSFFPLQHFLKSRPTLEPFRHKTELAKQLMSDRSLKFNLWVLNGSPTICSNCGDVLPKRDFGEQYRAAWIAIINKYSPGPCCKSVSILVAEQKMLKHRTLHSTFLAWLRVTSRHKLGVTLFLSSPRCVQVTVDGCDALGNINVVQGRRGARLKHQFCKAMMARFQDIQK